MEIKKRIIVLSIFYTSFVMSNRTTIITSDPSIDSYLKIYYI